MAISNLTGQKTYQSFRNLMQISSSGQVFDGLGNLVTSLQLTSSFVSGSSGGTGAGFPFSGSAVITGSLLVSSSLTVTGSVIATQGFTGSLFGTASYASQALSASFAVSSSRAVSSSFATQALSASWAPTQNIDTGSLVTTSSFNAFTSSYNTGSFTGSFTGSLLGTASFATTALSASWAQSASTAPNYLPLTGGIITGSLTITNNLTVLGSSSIQYISQSTLNIGTNLITLNTFTPTARFGGLAIIDSGSSPQVSASFLYDSVQDEFIFVHKGTAAGAITSSHFLVGPETYNDLGNETYLTANRIPKGKGNEHLNNSNISDNGSVVSINSNSEITGSLRVTSDFFAPIFYDSDNTYFYVNPSAASKLSELVVTSENGIQAPIYYDFNNTTYNVNPAGVSNLLNLNVGSTLNVSQGITGSLFGTSSFATVAATSRITDNTAVNITYYPIFAQGAGNNNLQIDTSTFSYNPSTNILTTTASSAVSSSYAVTASYAMNGGAGAGAAFPFTGSARITGSLNIIGPAIITGSLAQGAAGNITIGVNSHAEGDSTVASGSHSHAEGRQTIARGNWSHAEGSLTVAQGEYSHAEGYGTLALGSRSHAEGVFSTASGDYSHAEGGYYDAPNETTIPGGYAIGQASHAEGAGTIALGDASHVQGQYNITSSAQGAFILGNGTSDNNRSNLIFAAGTEVQITGSLRGNVISSSIASTTASLDLATSNFFTLTLANGANTHIRATNIQPGQTVNIRVTQGSAGTGTVSFNSAIKQSSGSLYTGSMIANTVDIVSLIAFDQTNAYISYINNFV